MTTPTTITLTARADMQEPLAGFVHRKALPRVRVRVADQCVEHQFREAQRPHRFTVTADIDPDGEDVTLDFVDPEATQAAVEIQSLHVNGAPMGMAIYQCEYTPHHTGEAMRSHLYLGWPGRWRLRLSREHLRHAGFGHV